MRRRLYSNRKVKEYLSAYRACSVEIQDYYRPRLECISNLVHFDKQLKYKVLKVHFRHLAVNTLPRYFITLLFSLTCFLTITRRKRPKSGPKTRFQSDFFTLLIICVPPIILGQVLTVVAIHLNSYVTSYDPCADAIE